MIVLKGFIPETKQVTTPLLLVSQPLQCLQEAHEFPLITNKSN